ncbi:MAG: patatin-like phospholipase family protein [Candidatus Paceibacterota bacterium]|jgi:NTE family protein
MGKKLPKIGLALGGGGAKGLAHIGVLEVLQENDIPIHAIAGTSMGALIGGMYALESDVDVVYEYARQAIDGKFLPVFFDMPRGGGFSSGEKAHRLIDTFVDNKTFQQTCVPFCAVATDLAKGTAVGLKSGLLSSAIRASISYPPIFDPMRIGKRVLVDGGLSNQVPVAFARAMGMDRVIAVNVDADYQFDPEKRMTPATLSRVTIKLLLRSIAAFSSASADVIIAPRVGDMSVWLDFNKMDEIILRGRKATEKALPAIRALLK